MGQVIVGNITIAFEDERLFSHVKDAIVSLITEHRATFFVRGDALGGRATALCGPNIPLHFFEAGDVPEADNDTWVLALVETALVVGTLLVCPEDAAEDTLHAALKSRNDDGAA